MTTNQTKGWIQHSALLLIGVFVLAFAHTAQAQGWISRADMPTSRGYLGGSVVDGQIYLFGGSLDESSNDPTRTVVEVYDPATDSWSQKADMPQGSFWLLDSVSAVDGKIYVMGMYAELFRSALHQVYMYDPGTDTWTQKADMPTNRVAPSTAVVDGKIYAIGGAGSRPFAGDHAMVEVYDPGTDTWSTEGIPALANARSGAFAAAVDGTIYVFGGWTGFRNSLASVEAFDTGTGSTSIDALDWGAIKASIDRRPAR